MLKFGIGFVRGGSCAGEGIPGYTWSVLETELSHAKDVCFHCGAADHFDCSCPDQIEWTKAHAPKCVLEVHNVPDTCLPAGLFEDRVTRQCMLKFGIGFVRGGSCAGKDIPEHTWSVLETELAHAKDVCFHCGAADHFDCSCPDRPGGTERARGAEDTEGAGAEAGATASSKGGDGGAEAAPRSAAEEAAHRLIDRLSNLID